MVKAIIEAAKANDREAQRIFVRHLLPRSRLAATPVDLAPGEDAAAIRRQISELVRLAAAGAFDFDALKLITNALRASIDSRVAELEEIVRDIIDHHEEDDRDGRVYSSAGCPLDSLHGSSRGSASILIAFNGTLRLKPDDDPR